MAEFASGTTIVDDRKALFTRFERLAEELMFILAALPVSRETSLAKTKLDECVMWAGKGKAA